MSIHRSQSQSSAKDPVSLEEVKRTRKLMEQDASLLANRIRLLQSEENRTRKRIEELKRKSELLQQVHARKEADRLLMHRVQTKRQQQAEAAREHFNMQRVQQTAERYRQKEEMWIAKKEVYTVGRAEREEALQRREEMMKRQEERNRELYMKVKEGKGRSRKRKLRPVKSDYEELILAEEERTAAKRLEVARMEQLELELINRLKLTQSIEEVAVTRLEKVARGSN